MAELQIERIKACSPQAKGRIERLRATLQDRLVIELRLLGINTIEEANERVLMLLKKHNCKFAVSPMKPDPSVILEQVFTIRKYHKPGHGITLFYNGEGYTFAKL